MLPRYTHSHRRLCSTSYSSWPPWFKPSLDIAVVIPTQCKCGQKYNRNRMAIPAFHFLPISWISTTSYWFCSSLWEFDRKKMSIESFSVFDSYFPYPQMLDANKQWEIKEAIEWVTKPSEFKPLWIKEPTFPDEDMPFQTGHANISKAGELIFFISIIIEWLQSVR